MKLLITADLHLVGEWKQAALDRLAELWKSSGADMLVIAGDIAIASEADSAFEATRSIVANRPICAVLGNHDLWVGQRFREQGANFEDVLAAFWDPAARQSGIHLLDVDSIPLDENLDLLGVYGHYDLGFAVPGLTWEGISVEIEHYVAGQPPGADRVIWNDARFLACQRGLVAEAKMQAALLDARLQETAAENRRAVVIVHTPPFEELIGGDRGRSGDPRFAFARAYVGNASMGPVIEKHAKNIALVVCGHTHKAVGPVEMHGVLAVNVGSDYGHPRALTFDTVTGKLERLGDAI